MAHDPGTSIVVTDGYWRHIRHTRVHHRHYPELRGEGASLSDAAAHLAKQLAHALDFTPGRGGREAIERALADVRALRPRRRGAAPAPGLTTFR